MKPTRPQRKRHWLRPSRVLVAAAVVAVIVAVGLAALPNRRSLRSTPTAGVAPPSAERTTEQAERATTSAPSVVLPAGGHAAPAGVPRPDPILTPGAVFASVTAAEICVPGYATSVRDVPSSEKAAVYAEYHVADVAGAHEVDHLISLELGGSNDIRNLWPEPYAGAYGAHAKDKVENYLHAQVCDGSMSLGAAQVAIATHWWDYLAAAAGPRLPATTTTTTAS